MVAALTAIAALTLTACSSGSGTATRTVTQTVAPSASAATGESSAAAPSDPPTSSSSAVGAPVHVSLLEGDGGVYGIGMPIIAFFDRKVTDATAFKQATTVTVNGKPAAGAWYWERSGRKGEVLEAHYRLQKYWPAHAKIYVDMPVKGLSAGAGLSFHDSLTLSIGTGAANISTVDCQSEKLIATSDGKTLRTLPTSCGKATTPTYTGTKVVMQKGEEIPGTSKLRPNGAVRMVSNNPADPYDLMVPWSVRITNSGEYVHAASWNGGNIGIRSTSNGCTNLNVDDARWFYKWARIGDVVTYTNTGGTPMPSWDGYGDWNVPWTLWQAGGVV